MKRRVLLLQPELSELERYHEDQRFLIVGTSQDLRDYARETFESRGILEDYFDPLYEERILQGTEEMMKSWPDSRFWEDVLHVKTCNLGETARHHLMNKVLVHKLSSLMALKNILAERPYDLVVGPSYLKEYCEVLGCRVYQPGRSVFPYFHHSFVSDRLPKSLVAVLNFFYHVIGLPVFGKMVNCFRPLEKRQGRIYLGILHELLHFFAHMPDAFRKPASVFIQARYYARDLKRRPAYGAQIPFRFCCLDGFFPFKKVFSVLKHYREILSCFRKNAAAPSFQSVFRFEGLNIWSLIKEDLENFLLIQSVAALKGVFIAEQLCARFEFQRVFFGYLNTWYYNTMNAFFQARGFKTETCAHGLIQQMALYTSSADINYNASAYDLDLMRAYSFDRSFVRLPVNSERARIDQIESGPVRRVLLLTKPYLDRCSENFSVDFVETTLAAVQARGLPLNRYVVIKTHPRENPAIYRRFLDARGLHDVTVDDGHFDEHLIEADFIFTPMSTVILDCIKSGKRFMVCRSNLFSGITFYREIDDLIAYDPTMKVDEIVRKMRHIETHDCSEIYTRLFNRYWFLPAGSPAPQLCPR